MSCRDRTKDFSLAIKTLQPQQLNSNTKNDTKSLIEKRSVFMPLARQLSKNISNTFAKLDKLTTLVQKKSLFKNNNIEINNLSLNIKNDMNNINNQLIQLQQINKTKNKNYSTSILLSLQSNLAKMSNSFKTVLQIRAKNITTEKARKDEFVISDNNNKYNDNSFLLQDEINSYNQYYPTSSSSSSSSSTYGYQGNNMTTVAMEANRYKQLQLIDEQDSYIESRSEAMMNIEGTIVELGTMFHQLADMVKLQEGLVQRIDSNVEDTSINIEGAHNELVKYFNNVSSNRWLMLKIFAVLIFFFIIFILFLT